MFTFLLTKVSDMGKPRIIQILNDLGRKVEQTVPDINYGGCGVFAGQVAAMLQYVDRVENVCVRVGCTYGVDNKNRVDQVLEESNAVKGEIGNILSENGIYNGHLVVQFDYEGVTYYYDTTGVVPAKGDFVPRSFDRRLSLYQGALTAETTLDYADETAHWNSCFDRKMIPKLTRIIETHIGEAASY